MIKVNITLGDSFKFADLEYDNIQDMAGSLNRLFRLLGAEESNILIGQKGDKPTPLDDIEGHAVIPPGEWTPGCVICELCNKPEPCQCEQPDPDAMRENLRDGTILKRGLSEELKDLLFDFYSDGAYDLTQKYLDSAKVLCRFQERYKKWRDSLKQGIKRR